MAGAQANQEADMPGTTIRVQASGGGTFDCYLALPAGGDPTPAVVLACSIDGVDADHRQIADEFAAAGFIAAAPDLFWRTLPGPLPSGDPRTHERSLPRLEKLATNERDLADTLAFLETLPQWNGRAAVIGFCYGGPFAIIGPKRLGYEAGIACHGSKMLDFLNDLDSVMAPVIVIWGDQDHRAPEPVLDAYRSAAAAMPNLEVHIFPGIEHGFMMPSHTDVFDAPARDFAMQRSRAILDGLRETPRTP
jgi:carboxymethylenebutenolidase